MVFFDYTNKEYISKMDNANKKIGIRDDDKFGKKDVVIIYTPPKVGSTTLVSSFRINTAGKFDVLHLHNDKMLKYLHDIHDATVMEIIYYNKFLGKQVYVIDIYRSPIEHKISLFFENIDTHHFNSPPEILKTYDIKKIINRFNKIFPHLITSDYYRTVYEIEPPEVFNFNNKYITARKDGIQFLKIRLKDSIEWKTILKNIFGIEIFIVSEYETEKKPIGELYKNFKKNYRIPCNLLDLVKDDEALSYYYSKNEKNEYLESWENKMTHVKIEPFTVPEFELYTSISVENKYMTELDRDHYIDMGCLCMGCSRKRGIFLLKLMKGEPIYDKIEHISAAKEYIKEKAKHMHVYYKKQNTKQNVVKQNFIRNFK
uniref:Uncharacterized protein n=1 Tax=viral metagenome TaxID=1070528 RepID=A0A6C0AZD4_9ZZZZ